MSAEKETNGQEHEITIIVNRDSYHVQSSTLSPAQIQSLVNAPADYEVWQVVKSPDPEGQLPKDDIRITGPVAIHDGERFRVVPPGTFGRAA